MIYSTTEYMTYSIVNRTDLIECLSFLKYDDLLMAMHLFSGPKVLFLRKSKIMIYTLRIEFLNSMDFSSPWKINVLHIQEA